MLQLFCKGLVVGISIAAPVGPIGLLCIRRTLADGRATGLATGLGAATADAVYGCVAGLGLTAISGVLVGQRFWLGLGGGVFLCYLGLRTFLIRPGERAAPVPKSGLLAAFLSTFALTLTNPLTILSFVAVFAGLGLGESAGSGGAIALVAGVFAGSGGWWLLLSGGVGALRTRVGPGWTTAINRVSGLLLFAFGAYALAAGWRA